MKTKTETKPKMRDGNEERFYKFARALMAVPKKEIDKIETKKKLPHKQYRPR